MKRIDAIQRIVHRVNERTVIVASNGMISRELYQIKDRDLNFYMMGSMGCALSIGIGVAYTRPDLKVVVLSGDGSALMNLGTMVLHKEMRLSNLTHYILDNNVYASTGGQKTCSKSVNFCRLAPNTFVMDIDKGKGESPRVPLSPIEIQKRFRNAISNIK